MVTSYVYDDAGQIVRTVTRGAWTAEDRALVLAYRMYRDTLCRCGEPKATAWHWDNEGFYEVDEDEDFVTCHACTALEQSANPDADPVRYPVNLRYTRTRPLPPFDPTAPISRAPIPSKSTSGGADRGSERPVGHSPA